MRMRSKVLVELASNCVIISSKRMNNQNLIALIIYYNSPFCFPLSQFPTCSRVEKRHEYTILPQLRPLTGRDISMCNIIKLVFSRATV